MHCLEEQYNSIASKDILFLMLLNLFILTSVVSSQVMTFACAQKFATEFAAGTPSVATCLSSNGGTNFPLRCGAGCLNTLNTFPSRISSDCSGQILLNLGNGSEIRVNTMDKFFDAMTAVTCQVAPFGSQRTFCLEQIADDIINEPDYVATGLVCSSCSRRLVTAIKKWGPLIPFLSTSISEVLKLYDNVCTPSDRFLTVSQPYSEECSNSITNETALDAIRNSCAAPMTLIADSETYTLTNTGLETICDVPCTSKTKEYTEEVVNSCANSSFSVLGYNTAASDISTTMDNLKSVMCLKNGPDFCINGYLQSLITKIVLTVFGTVGLNVPIFSNSTELCTSCVRDEVALMESFEGDSFQSSLGSTLSETSKLINQTCVNTDFEFPTSLDACLDSIGDTSTLSNACTGNVAALSTDSLNPALMDRVCSTDCSDAITDYDLALGTDCTGGNNPSLTQVLGDSVRGTIQNVTNVLCTSQNSQYCLLNILNSVFTQCKPFLT